MLKFIVTLLFCLCAVSMAHGQSIVSLARTGLFRRPVPIIQRTTTTYISRYWVADQAIMAHNPNRVILRDHISGKVQLYAERAIAEHTLKDPVTIFGPYNYVKTVTRAAELPNVVKPEHLAQWKKVHKVDSYRGVHHIVNKFTLRLIYADLRKQGKKVSLDAMQKNAPAILHPLHGDPAFEETFHDAEKQYEDYNTFGMKVVVMGKLAEIDQLNTKMGLPTLSIEFIQGTLKEAELWCAHNGMVWEHSMKIEVK